MRIMISNSEVLDTSFRSAIDRMINLGRIEAFTSPIDTNLATMGSQMPEQADELAAAGGFCGRPLPVVKAVTQDLLVPADTEIVLEGRILPDQMIEEGPFGEFVGYLSPPGDAPIFEITSVTHRERPLYPAIHGY